MKLHRGSLLAGIALTLTVVGTAALAWVLAGSPAGKKGPPKAEPPAVVAKIARSSGVPYRSRRSAQSRVVVMGEIIRLP